MCFVPIRTGFHAGLLSLLFACASSGPVIDVPVSATASSTDATDATDATNESSRIRIGGQPTEVELRAWASEGLELVIDLRSTNEARGIDEAEILRELGIRYIALPIARSSDLDWDNAAALDAYLTDSEGPVLVHCRSGNRVGALMALRYGLNTEASTEAALDYGRRHGLTSRELEATVSELLDAR